MNEFVWTDELVTDFAYWYKNLSRPVYDPLNEFKKSREVKKEYEILEFKRVSTNKIEWVLQDDGTYRNVSSGCPGFTLERLLDGSDETANVRTGKIKIHSVKRLSDGEVFTIGDKTQVGVINKIEKHDSMPLVFYCGDPDYPLYFYEAKKEVKKEPLFITDDGVEIFESIPLWLVNKEFYKKYVVVHKHSLTVGEFVYQPHTGNKYFMTEQKADEYILFNKPCLCLNDLLDNWGEVKNDSIENRIYYRGAPIFKNFEKAAKQKIL